MSLFFKDPKTCMNPWRGLWIVVFVCGMVILILLTGKVRYEASLGRKISGDGVVAVPADNKLRF